MTSIDVIICAYNEAARIPQALGSLKQQTVGVDTFRVILVDNASRDATRQVVEQNQDGLNLTYTFESRPGLNAARNTGLAVGSAEYAAFLDADASAHPDWLARIRATIAEFHPDLCGGPYYPYFVGLRPNWFLDRYNSSRLGMAARFLGSSEFLSGTNTVWRRSLVTDLGGFDHQVGLVGRGLARGDETELMMRAWRINPDFKVYYDPEAIVYHYTRPETYHLTYWIRRNYVQGRRWRTAMMRGNTAWPPDWAGQLWLGGKALGRFALGTLLGPLFRNRARYPYYENFMYERVIPEVGRLGEMSAWLLPERPKERGD
jgi:glycosyltransferase involved in cell wall biosynthesis